MKKIYILGALAVAVTALFSCNKEQEVTINEKTEGTPFEIVAGSVETKTVNDGVHTTWAAGDAINLFHAVSGQSVYVSDGSFTTDEAGTNVKFAGTLSGTLSEDSYDWYAIYPYNVNIGTPANTGSKGYVTVGSASNASQAQMGNNSTAHIAGSKYPVAGKVLNVAKDEKPEISMNHLTSLVAVEVTNGTSGPISVSNVSFTGTEDIVGTFFIDFVSSPVVYTKSGDSYVSATASLNVTSGEAIASGAKATFYLAVKPFTAPAGETITLSVTTNNGTQTVTSSALSSAFSFVAGKKHKLSFNYTKTPAGKAEPTSKTGWYRVDDSDWLAAGDRVVIVNHDGSKAMSRDQKTNNRDGVNVSIEADGDYTKLTSNDDVQVFIVEAGTVSGSFAFWCENGDEASKYIYASSSSSNNMKSQYDLDANASFIPSIPDGLGSLTAQGTNTRKVLRYNNSSGSNLFSCYASATNNDISLYKYYGTWGGSTTCADPTITQEENTVTISCATKGVTIYYTTDGSNPDKTNDGQKYTHAFSITEPVTVKAIAVRSHYTDSGIASKDCAMNVAAPVISSNGTSFSISCATDGATIYYKTSTVSLADIVEPLDAPSVYSAAVPYAVTTYVKAYAVKAGYTSSAIVSQTCTYSSGSSSVSYSWSLASGDLGADKSPVASVTKGVLSSTDAGISWSLDYSWPSGAQKRMLWDSSNYRGVQIGTGSAAEKCNSVSLTTTGFTENVTKIVVGANTASSGNATLSVSVNGVAFKSNDNTSVSLNTTTTPTTYEFTGSATGTIVITLTNSANKALYIKSIEINKD